MSALSEADTRAKLIDPAVHGRGWTEDLIKREESAGEVEIIPGRRPRRKARGRTDYTLRVRVTPDAQPVAVALLEAKKESLPPGHGLDQAKGYARAARFNVPFVFASNGHLFVEFDRSTGLTAPPRPLAEFPTPDDLRARYEQAVGFPLTAPAAKPLLTRYAGGEGQRRYFQDAAIRAVFEKVARCAETGQPPRALLSLATGTGKTFIAVNLLKRASDAGLLKKALFLCDRDELRTQGLRAMQALFGADAAEVFEDADGNNHARNALVHVATYQTLGIDRDGADASFLTRHYPPGSFSHVVIDECHRSAWGKWSAVLTRNPAAVQVGLTATRLGDVCDLLPSKSIATTGDAEVTAITTACLSESGFLPGGVKLARMRRSDIAHCRVASGEVLIARSNTPELVGRAAMYGGQPPDVVASDLTIRLWPRDDLSSAFLAAYLSHLFLTGYWRERAGGASGSMKKITREQITNELIPLPPPAEQERIAAELRVGMAAADRARRAAADRLAAAEALPAAYLREVFEEPNTGEWEDWQLDELSDTCSGATPPRDQPDYFGGGIPWVKTGELKDGQIEATEETVSEAALRDCSLPRLPPGTLLIAMYGQGQTRGRTGLLTCEATTNQACFAILPNAERFEPGMLQLWFRANYHRLRAFTENRGGNQPNLNGVLLRQLKVRLPPLHQQQSILNTLTVRLAAAHALIARCREELAVVEAVPAALLRQAFHGTA